MKSATLQDKVKNLLVHTLRIVSYLVVPVGAAIAGSFAVDCLFGLILYKLTDLLWYGGMISIAFILPLLIILYFHPKSQSNNEANVATHKNPFNGLIYKPSTHTVIILLLLICLGLAPVGMILLLSLALGI